VTSRVETQTRAPWRLIDIIFVMSAYIGLVLALTAVAFALGLIRSEQSQLNIMLAVTILVDAIIVFFIIWLVRRRGGGAAHLGFRPLSAGAIYLPALGFLVALGILIAYAAVVQWLGVEELVPRNNAPRGVFESTTSTVLFGCLAIIFAPIAEEVIFRGFLFGGLRKWFAPWLAVIVSGLLFGLVHAELGVIIPISLIGMLLAVIYLQANSILASMGTHFLFNTVSFFAALLMERT
jgi:membrane protease YdiL (CAAX protease family)